MTKSALLAAIAFSVVSAGIAAAADLPPRPAPPPVKAPVMVEPVFIWTGFYLGAHGGWAGGDAKYTFLDEGRFNPNVFGDTASQSLSGGMAGGHIGFNWQFGNFVAGIEGSGDWSGVKKSVASPFFADTDTWTTKVKWLATITPRIGVAASNWLFYAKGGVAFASISNRLEDSGLGFVEDTVTRTGWTAGGGIEVLLTPNWVLGLEGNYYDFGKFNVNQFGTAFLGGTFDPGTNHDLHTTMWSVLGRVSYKFGGPGRY
jgi:outer membrane immunogenic protein